MTPMAQGPPAARAEPRSKNTTKISRSVARLNAVVPDCIAQPKNRRPEQSGDTQPGGLPGECPGTATPAPRRRLGGRAGQSAGPLTITLPELSEWPGELQRAQQQNTAPRTVFGPCQAPGDRRRVERPQPKLSVMVEVPGQDAAEPTMRSVSRAYCVGANPRPGS